MACFEFSSAARRLRLRLGVWLLVLLGIPAGLHAAATVAQFGIPTAGAGPHGIVYGPDGAYWFVENSTGYIGRVDTNGNVTEFGVPTAGSGPFDITVGPEKTNLWFTESLANQLARIVITNLNPIGISVTEFPILNGNGTPLGICAGPDGNLWFTQLVAQIGTMTTNGVTTNYTQGITPLFQRYYNGQPVGNPVTNFLWDIVAGPDGNLWFTEFTAGIIGRITTGGAVTEYPIPLGTNAEPANLITGLDGSLWFTEYNSNKIGRVNFNAGVLSINPISDFPVPTPGSLPYGLTSGPGGNIWFSELAANQIGRIVPNGTNTTNIVEFPIPSAPGSPEMMASGPDGNIWVTEPNLNAIGELLQPLLQIIQTTNAQVVISWTDIATGFQLQSNTNITTTNWVNVTNVPVVVGTNFVVTNPAVGITFYRLIQ